MSTTSSMIRYNTVFEATQNLPFTFAIGHGESVDLIASITDEGVLVDLSDYTARAIYQPKSKFGTDDWYECPCEKVENTVVVHWTNIQDNGDNAVILWLHFIKDNKVCYPALYKFRLFETPGFQPSAITVIPDTLDFSMYTLVNAPWATQSDFNDLSETVEGIQTELGTVADSVKYTRYVGGIGTDSDTITPTDRGVYGYMIANGVAHSSLNFPAPETGKVTDYIIDIDNSNNTSDYQLLPISGNWAYAIDENEDSILTVLNVEKQTMVRLYFSSTGIMKQVASNFLPMIHISKKVIKQVSIG